MIKASTLGHSGIGEPATSTSGRITNRINCPIAIRPNMMLATRNPVICDLIVFSLDVGLIGLMGQSQSHKSYKSHKQTGKCHSSDFFSRSVSLQLESQAVVTLHLRMRAERRAEPV